MEDFQSQKQVMLNVLEQAAKIASSSNNHETAQELRGEAEHLRAGELNVDICGEAKRGKSSLINAFLEEVGLCPVDAQVATNAITRICYAAKEKILVHFEEARTGSIETAEISREEIKDYVTEQGNRGNARNVKLVEIWIDNPKLKDGLVLIDTPGVGGLNIDHTAATYAIIPFADAVIFTGSADQPLTVHELDFAERIGKHTPTLMFVLTKRDRAQNWQERLNNDLAKLEKHLKAPPGSLSGVALSSTIKTEYLHDRDDDLLAISGFPEFERAMWHLLGKRSAILIGRAQGRVLTAISQLRFPLDTEKQGLEAKSAAELKEIQDELEARVRRADELSIDSALWVGTLNSEMAKLQSRCTKELADQFATLHQAVDGYLKISDYVNDPNKLGSMLTVDSNNSFAVILENVENELGDIVLDLKRTTSLELEKGAASIDTRVEIQIVSDFKRKGDSGLKKASDLGRASTMNSMGLGTAGGFTGAIMGGIIGIFAGPGGVVGGAIIGAKLGSAAGALVGGVFGIKRGISEIAERDLVWLRQNLGEVARSQLSAAHRTLSHELNILLTSVRNDIHQDLLRQIQREKKVCQEAVVGLERSRQVKQADAAQEIRKLSNALKKLEHLREAASSFSSGSSTEAAATA